MNEEKNVIFQSFKFVFQVTGVIGQSGALAVVEVSGSAIKLALEVVEQTDVLGWTLKINLAHHPLLGLIFWIMVCVDQESLLKNLQQIHSLFIHS